MTRDQVLLVRESKYVKEQHPFHIVDQSLWPLCVSGALLYLTNGTVLCLHNYLRGPILLQLGLFLLLFSMFSWWKDVVREGTFLGKHTVKVQFGLRLGMSLFILSEVMFFISFFWAFLHSSLAPSIEIGSVWPPVGMPVFDSLGVPLLNTLILLLSGSTCTWVHGAICMDKVYDVISGFRLTILLAIIFTLLQLLEYATSRFNISDGIYGSVFFMSTGFHGFHVIVGTIFLYVQYRRFLKGHFSKDRHFGFEASAWYWHFVDVVWLILYFLIYCWGNSLSEGTEIVYFIDKLNLYG